MAKPIKITPVLKGTDAVVFFNKLKENERLVPNKAKRERIRKDAHILKSIFKSK